MVERTVRSTVAHWRPLALGAALGYVTLIVLARWTGSRRRARLGDESNGFHPILFL